MFWKKSYSKKEIILFFLAPLFLLLALELVRFRSFKEVYMEFQTGWTSVKWLISYLFLLSWEGFFLALTGSTFLADLIVSIFIYAMGLVSIIMCHIIGDPLLPNHMFLAAQAEEISSFVKIIVTPAMVIGIAMVTAYLVVHGLVVHTHKKRGDSPKKRRPVLALILILICAGNSYFLCFNSTFRYDILSKMDVTIAAFNPIDNYWSNGLVLTFFPRIGSLFAEKPEGYSKENIESIKREFESKPMTVCDSEQKPNIIAIQSEALWDPTLLPNATFSQDPMPIMHRLIKKGQGGKLVSPVFEGGTCLPEFEFLTGFSTGFLYSTAYPYIQYVTKQTPSFVSALRDNGYHTVALHTYQKNFYSRNTAYPLLGFDEFIGLTDLENPEKSGAYVSDMEVTRQTIRAFEESGDAPLFMFDVTMQNHGAYQGNRYEAYDITVSCPGLSEEDLGGLQAYTQGVYEADKALGAMIDYFDAQSEPTLIIIYGDHLPLLGTEESTYKIGGLIPNQETVDMPSSPQLYETPYVVWSNYGADMTLPKHISAAKLGLEMFRASGVTDFPWYYHVINAFYQKWPVFQHYIAYDEQDQVTVTPQDEVLTREYKWIQFDVLNGKRYYQK